VGRKVIVIGELNADLIFSGRRLFPRRPVYTGGRSCAAERLADRRRCGNFDPSRGV